MNPPFLGKEIEQSLDSSSFWISSMSVGSMSLPSNQSDSSEADRDGLFGKLAGSVRQESFIRATKARSIGGKIGKRLSLHQVKWPHPTGVYPGFCRIK